MKILLTLIAVLLSLKIFSPRKTETAFTQCFCGYYTDCYTINNVKANWDTANDTCVKQGGIFINDFYDLVYYQINVILQANNGTENYWNGLRRVGNTSQFKWTDGRISNFYDWKSNNPKDGIDCVGVDGESGQLVSLECNTKNNFACSIYLYGDICIASANNCDKICFSSIFNSDIPSKSLLRNLALKIKVPTDDIIEFYTEPKVIVATQVSANNEIKIPIYRDIIQLGTESTDPSQESTILIMLILYGSTSKFDNTTFSVKSDIITIYTSNNLITPKMTILFENNYFYHPWIGCVYLRPDGNWSTEGLDTRRIESVGSVLCTTNLQDIITIAVIVSNY